MNKLYVEVSKNDPCIECGKDSWCSRSIDGDVYFCRRISEGIGETQHDKNGAPFQVVRVGNEKNNYKSENQYTKITSNIKIADTETLNEVYTELLHLLSLNEDDLTELKNRGFTENEIQYYGYRSIDSLPEKKIVEIMIKKFSPSTLKTIPGFYESEVKKAAFIFFKKLKGIAIPVKNKDGKIIAIKIRTRNKNKNNLRYFYLSSTKEGGVGPGAKTHISLPENIKEFEVIRITEGELKSDISSSKTGIITFGLPGVGNASKLVENLKHFDPKTVKIAFDRDLIENENVAYALETLVEKLKSENFDIELEEWDDNYNGIDDAIVSGSSIKSYKIESMLDAKVSTDPLRKTPYRIKNGYFIFRKETVNGIIDVPLSNFIAKIDIEEFHEDGISRKAYYKISGNIKDGSKLQSISIPASSFSGFQWISEHWGARAVPAAGSAVRDRLREAIQLRSKDSLLTKDVFIHTGWRKVDKKYCYLTSSGAIFENGLNEEVCVEPDNGELSLYNLPCPQKNENLSELIKKALILLKILPNSGYLVLATPFRAVLSEVKKVDFSVFISGPTGSFKSEICAIVQSFFGKDFNSRSLPECWSSTENAIERKLFLAKDAVLVIDDFAPVGSLSDIACLHKKADRVFRGQGNSSGRSRLKSDSSLMPAMFPRGLILASGEDIPKGASLRARLSIIELNKDMVDIDALTLAQSYACAGVFAQIMSSFIQYLSPKIDFLKKSLLENHHLYRIKANNSLMHARCPDMIASQMLAVSLFFDWAHEMNAISNTECEEYKNNAWISLIKTGDKQGEFQNGQKPSEKFIDLLKEVFIRGLGHLVLAENGGAPDNPQWWGWRTFNTENSEDLSIYKPLGEKIGWISGDEVYLNFSASFTLVSQIARDQGDSIGVTKETLIRRLVEDKFALKDDANEKNLFRRMVEGETTYVLIIPDKCILLSTPEYEQKIHTLNEARHGFSNHKDNSIIKSQSTADSERISEI